MLKVHTLRTVKTVLVKLAYEKFELDGNPIRYLRQELAKWAYFLDDLCCKSLTNAKLMKHLKNPTSHKRTSHSVCLLTTLFLYSREFLVYLTSHSIKFKNKKLGFYDIPISFLLFYIVDCFVKVDVQRIKYSEQSHLTEILDHMQ
ncbi:hypothetical protein HN011_005929 [Eciton burchellii]|nr:hypothetical protein HN011_005929 [Eciton burchellii]